VLEAAFILLEFSSPSRRIFIGCHSLPPLWFAVSVLHTLVPLARVGRPGASPATCAAPAANGAPRAVRRPADERHLAQLLATDGPSECSPAVAQRPAATPAPRRACPKRVRRVRRVADVAAHDIAPKCVSAFPVLLAFHSSVFKIAFLSIFTLKCILRSEAKLKIRHSSTTFTKIGRGLVQAIEQERHANLAKFSAPVNRNKTSS
jgi:hypothetical protein